MSTLDQVQLVNGDHCTPEPSLTACKSLNVALGQDKYVKFHGDALIGDKERPTGLVANLRNSFDDIRRVLSLENMPAVIEVASKMLLGQGLDIKAGAGLIGSLSNDSNRRAAFIEDQVKSKYDRMLHPPLTYLGDAFQYRSQDGRYNSVLHPHLGQAGAPYAKTVPSKTHPLGALPDPGDLFDRLMSRDKDDTRESPSGLSSMLIYHATIIIHDIFRTNDSDKNISDSSSYLDLSPLYGYTMDMQRKVRDGKYKLGMLKPDTFAEDRLLRQPPGVCIMLVMYNRYHNYAATQLRRINENGRFSIPIQYRGNKLVATARKFVPHDKSLLQACDLFEKAWKLWDAAGDDPEAEAVKGYEDAAAALQSFIDRADVPPEQISDFQKAHDAAWDKLDDDLFNTARLITCGMYVQISIHDYLRALMGFHQYDTNFTLDPRIAMTDHKNASRGLGNQVAVEFNLLYRFHCAISKRNEEYVEEFLRRTVAGAIKAQDLDPPLKAVSDLSHADATDLTLPEYLDVLKVIAKYGEDHKKDGSYQDTMPWQQTFGLPLPDGTSEYVRNRVTGLFDDQRMIDELKASMDDPIAQFGPKGVPQSMKSIEIMGILQARKWGIGTLNDFREFFGMTRHETFESIQAHEVADALRDLYEHPDKVELYPGIFCESDKDRNVDPGPSDVDSALWAAIFSDAITLVRSDRFYTVDWNTNSLTSWGMKELTEDNDNLKSSVFHRLIQRAFPGWFPYDSIRFFHPFYTSQQNAKFAHEQGYAPEFKMSVVPKTNVFGQASTWTYNVKASDPAKPVKPLYLDNFTEIAALLADKSGNIAHPVHFETLSLPPPLEEVLKPRYKHPHNNESAQPTKSHRMVIEEHRQSVFSYFIDLMEHIVVRESVKMPGKHATVYQIDITRDFAIPVTTRYVADLLGFGHKIRDVDNPKAPFSENEIYQHITNCQTFFSYNADETKMLRRRKAFKSSIQFLFELTKQGHIVQANRGTLERCTRGSLEYLFSLSFTKRRNNAMTHLGFKLAQDVLLHEGDMERAAAVLLLIALDGAYNSVLAFTSVLDVMMNALYDVAAAKYSDDSRTCQLQDIQHAHAFNEDPGSIEHLETIVLEAQRRSVRVPIVRMANKDTIIKNGNNCILEVQAGQMIVCDIHAASERVSSEELSKHDHLPYESSFTQHFLPYQSKHIAVMGLAAMIKVVGRMQNVRRGHDWQGKLKKINIDSSAEGYSNFVAPLRMAGIAHAAERLGDEGRRIYTEEILSPANDVYLTPEWDEMVPFPTTWKLRFDGFGNSDYGGPGLKQLAADLVKAPDDVPPFYQSQGSSHFGGTFSDVSCVCRTPGFMCRCTAANADVMNSDATSDGSGLTVDIGNTSYITGQTPKMAHALQLSFKHRGCGPPALRTGLSKHAHK